MVMGLATQEEKSAFAHELAMAYLQQQNLVDLSPTDFYNKYVYARDEIFRLVKKNPNPYVPGD